MQVLYDALDTVCTISLREINEDDLRSRATVSLFHKFDVSDVSEENRTC